MLETRIEFEDVSDEPSRIPSVHPLSKDREGAKWVSKEEGIESTECQTGGGVRQSDRI